MQIGYSLFTLVLKKLELLTTEDCNVIKSTVTYRNWDLNNLFLYEAFVAGDKIKKEKEFVLKGFNKDILDAFVAATAFWVKHYNCKVVYNNNTLNVCECIKEENIKMVLSHWHSIINRIKDKKLEIDSDHSECEVLKLTSFPCPQIIPLINLI